MTARTLLVGCLMMLAGSLHAQTPAAPAGQTGETPLPNKVLGRAPLQKKFGANAELTYILQSVTPFHSPYFGTNSLRSRRETEASRSYTLYLWAHPSPRFEVYVNPELALGHGIGDGDGLAAYSNGDLIGQPNFRPQPYLARVFIRYRVPLQSGGSARPKQAVKPGNEEIGGSLPASRLVFIASKFAISDHIDINTYANNARNQFLNNAFVNNLAYDKAGDPRGYTHGIIISVLRPGLAVRIGSVALPAVSGGRDVSYNLRNQHAEQLETEIRPKVLAGQKAMPLILRLLTYRNEGTMGSYRDALQAAPGMTPDVTTVRRRAAFKYGFGLNFEQGISDGGASGVFGRFGWNDGQTETFSYAEADRVMSFGGQVSGAHWKRASDVLGVALAQSDLSSAHKEYLAAGGLGPTLGDGALSYGSERVAEVYYSYQLTSNVSLSPDYQYISNPGFNHDRGPVSLISLRLHLTF